MNEYFRELRSLSQKIDSDIENLEKTWDSPHLLIGGYGDNVEEAGPYLERFLGDIKDLQDQLIDAQEPRAKYLSDTNEYINTMETFYEQLKQNCEDVETLLSDWGYKPVPDNSECLPTDESETESSILTSEQMVDSPSPCTNYTNSDKTDMFFTPTVKMDEPKSIATPAIMSLGSVMKFDQRNRSNISSTLDRPSKEFLSPYYGRRMK